MVIPQPEVLVNGVPLDKGLIPLPVGVTHGRSSATGQPDAPVTEFIYLGELQPGKVGDTLHISNGSGGMWSDSRITWASEDWSWNGVGSLGPAFPRFHGEIESVKATGYDRGVQFWTVRAIGRQARLGNIHINMKRAEENDIDRAKAIAEKAGLSLNGPGPGTFNIVGEPSLMLAPDDIDRSALDALHEVCASTGGLLWQGRDGSIWYGTSNHRNDTPIWVLPAATILDGIDWEISDSDIINHLTIKFPAEILGIPPITGPWFWDPNLDTGSTPANGTFRTNDPNATQVSTIAINEMNHNGVDSTLKITRRLAGDRLWMFDRSDPTHYAMYTLTGPPIDNGDWFTIPVDFKDHGEKSEPDNNRVFELAFDSRPQGVERQKTFSDEESMAQWGRRHADVTTLCADEKEAGVLALTILARRSQPYWQMPGIFVPYEDLNDADARAMQNLDMSVGLLAPVPRDPGRLPSSIAQWVVEGYYEEWREDGYWTQLALTDRARSAASVIRSWQRVADTLNYEEARAKTFQKLLVEVI